MSKIIKTALNGQRLAFMILVIVCLGYQQAATATSHPPAGYRAIPDPAALVADPNMQVIKDSGLYFGNWTLDAQKVITPTAGPAGFSYIILAEGDGMLQQRVTDASGNAYIQLIIAEELGTVGDGNDNTYYGVGAFGESFIKVNGNNAGIASYQGLRCLTSCRDEYPEAPNTQFESSTKLQMGDPSTLGNDAEKIRIKTLKWDTSIGDPWEEFGVENLANESGYNEGFTTYADIWRATYDTGTTDGPDTIKADFTRVSLITEDVSPYYAYTNAQHYFQVGDTGTNDINDDNPNAAKEALAQQLVGKIGLETGIEITSLTEAINYIEDYMEYTMLEAHGFRLSDQGFIVQDANRTNIQGALVKAGHIEYLNSGEIENPKISWMDGDTIMIYEVHAEIDLEDINGNATVGHLSHAEFKNLTTPTYPFADEKSRLNALYSLDDDVPHNPSYTTFYDEDRDTGLYPDSRVGLNQFEYETIDLIDPFSPW